MHYCDAMMGIGVEAGPCCTEPIADSNRFCVLSLVGAAAGCHGASRTEMEGKTTTITVSSGLTGRTGAY